MKMSRVKRLSLIILSLVFACSLSLPTYAASVKPELKDFKKIAENSRLILYSNLATGEIAVENRTTGYIWGSNPTDRENDKIARGVQKMNLFSQLLVNCSDKENNATLANNYTGSIKVKPPVSEKIQNGIKFTFNFSASQIKIPVQYMLCEDYVKAEILTSQISEYGENRIMDISLLPFFGAGGLNDKGYIFVPDGSGALINFNNGKSYYKAYEEPIYGRDKSLNEMFSKDNKETVKMPVFGIKNGEDAFLAVVNEGDFLGTINAWVSGWKTSSNNAFCTFRYRAKDSTVLAAQDYSAKDVAKVESGHAEVNSFEVRYYILNNEQADYSGMAARYQKFLIEEKGLKGDSDFSNIPFYLELYGGVRVKKSVLGLPLNVTTPLTTYKQSADIVEKLKDSGVGNIVLRYTGWMKNGIDQKIPSSAVLESKLGGKKEFNRLISLIDQNSGNISLFPDADFVNVYKAGNGFQKYSDAARDVFNDTALQYRYKVSTTAKDTEMQPWFLTSLNNMLNFFKSFIDSYSHLKIRNLSVGHMGDTVYSDFNKKEPMDREQAGKALEESLAFAKSEIGDIMVENANMYALKDASHVTGIPLTSSKLDIEDESIPFYQMVLHGLIPYSSTAENLCSDQTERFLKDIETGAYPYYTWTWGDTSALKETDYNYLYSTKYTLWIDSAVQQYKELNGIFSKLVDNRITGHHKIQDGVYETVFDNGTRILVNYNTEGVSVQGDYVEGKGYIVVAAGNQ